MTGTDGLLDLGGQHKANGSDSERVVWFCSFPFSATSKPEY
jgi:hypothetical protein